VSVIAGSVSVTVPNAPATGARVIVPDVALRKPMLPTAEPAVPRRSEVVEPATSVVNTPVDGVVAPTVPLMLIEAVPVRLVTVPEDGVPSAPLKRTGAPADPMFTARAARTPVPNVIVAYFPSRAVCRPEVLAIERALSAIAVAFPTDVTTPVRLALVVTVAAFPVILPAIALVTCKSVNHPFVIRVPVEPISPVSCRFAPS